MIEQLLTIAEVAGMLGVSGESARRVFADQLGVVDLRSKMTAFWDGIGLQGALGLELNIGLFQQVTDVHLQNNRIRLHQPLKTYLYTNMDEQLLTIAEVAGTLGVSRDRARRVFADQPGVVDVTSRMKASRHRDGLQWVLGYELNAVHFLQLADVHLQNISITMHQPPKTYLYSCMDEQLLTIAEVAGMLGVSRDTARRMFADQPGVVDVRSKMKSGRPYRILRIPRSIFDSVLASRAVKGDASGVNNS